MKENRDHSLFDHHFYDEFAIPFTLYDDKKWEKGFVLIDKNSNIIRNGEKVNIHNKRLNKIHDRMLSELPPKVHERGWTTRGRIWIHPNHYPVLVIDHYSLNIDWKTPFREMLAYLNLSLKDYVYWDDTRYDFSVEEDLPEESEYLTTFSQIISPNASKKSATDSYYEKLGIFENLILYDMLSESKQVGELYHFTDLYKLISILQLNALIRGPSDSDFYNGISLTRNKNLNWSSVKIALDGDKLSQKYKIKPFCFSGYLYNDNNRHECEERVISDNIKNLSNYIKFIEIYDLNFKNEIIKDILCDYYNIEKHELGNWESNINELFNVFENLAPNIKIINMNNLTMKPSRQ